MKKRLIIVLLFTVFIFCFGFLYSSEANATEKWVVLGNTIWVSGDSRLTLEMPSVSHPYLKVTSNTAGDLQWIDTNIPFTWGSTIKGIILCYQTPNTGTFISQIRLADYSLPSPGTVHHDDGTDLISADGACYLSPVSNYVPQGSVNLRLRLNFAAAGHEIRLGALAVLIDEP